MKILIVEDNANMREVVKSMFASTGAEFLECSDGSDALSCYKEFLPDWVLMDIRMKKVDGLQATKYIKQYFPDANIVVMTQYDDPDYRNEAGKLGIKGFVLKDNLHQLRDIILPKRPNGKRNNKRV
jgi:CheY-like chemotaxis protein